MNWADHSTNCPEYAVMNLPLFLCGYKESALLSLTDLRPKTALCPGADEIEKILDFSCYRVARLPRRMPHDMVVSRMADSQSPENARSSYVLCARAPMPALRHPGQVLGFLMTQMDHLGTYLANSMT